MGAVPDRQDDTDIRSFAGDDSMPVHTKACVLVVDDSPVIRLSLAAVLEVAGHEVVEAASGEEALQLAATRDFDAVILDVDMPPGISGIEVGRVLRTRVRSWSAMIAMHSLQPAEVIEASFAEFDALLPKPCPVAVLLPTIERFVSQKRVAGGSRLRRWPGASTTGRCRWPCETTATPQSRRAAKRWPRW